jgi:hypothetical protein
MLFRVLCAVAMMLGFGCGGGHHAPAVTAVSSNEDAGQGSGSTDCKDQDGDNYGVGLGCIGRDCDDTNPMITDQCIRCAMPAVNCPCDPGTKPTKCDPHYSMKVMGGTFVCSEGSRYCRDGVYSDCEVLMQYVMFISD